MNLKEIKQTYQNIIDRDSNESAKLKKDIFRIGTVRLVVILAGLYSVYHFWGAGWYIVLSLVSTAIVFALLLKYHQRLHTRKLYCDVSAKDAQNELNGLDYNFSAFDGASDKIDGEHSFSLDLDLFGDRSFFQSINRTATPFGKDILAGRFMKPLRNKAEILRVQDAVKELSTDIDRSFRFRTIGNMAENVRPNLAGWRNLFAKPSKFYGNIFWQIMLYLVPASYVVLGGLCAFGIVEASIFLPLWIGLLVFSSLPLKNTIGIAGVLDSKEKVLKAYSSLFAEIENADLKSELLWSIQQDLKESEASKTIRNLQSYLENMSQSVTFPVMFFFNPVLLWNVRYAYKIEKWMKDHQNNVEKWFEAVGNFDSLVSLAMFAYNHPDYTYPNPKDKFVFEGKGLGHPLINRDVCVRNDVSIPQKGFFLVVTGANMAGKSTYLRTIGLNHLLANIGAPVCAEELSFYPGSLITNLRTSDSLADNESYFFAELKRLKMIIDRLQEGEEIFIILDEILKGTNSQDKQRGSIALMKQLVSLQGNGIIATHDLVLGDLENEFPDNVKDYCFEADIRDNNLSFTYKLRDGVAQNMNACFLMKKMGIAGLED